MPISSAIIDLPLVTVCAPAVAADGQDDVAGFLRIAGEMHVPAGRSHLLLIGFEIEVEMLAACGS